MLLSRLLGPEGPQGGSDLDIAGIAAHSADVKPGFLFAALKGAKSDGGRFVADALARGAVAVLADRGSAIAAAGACVVEVDDARHTLALAAARFFNRQPHTVVAVTGTNGKTSTVNFVRQIWQVIGNEAASIGTLGVVAGAKRKPLRHTTPDPVELHGILADLAASGVTHAALEASSHGLDQRRLDGVRLRAAAFTNLTRDHLDYHGTPDAYFRAKRLLFTSVLPADGVAVLNADAPEYTALAADCRARGVRTLSYGRAASELKVLGYRPNGSGTYVEVSVGGPPQRIRVPLVGEFQVWNVLCAAGLVLASGGELAVTLRALERLEGVPGRMQQVAEINGARVFVDYAHTPDAIEKVLRALRPHARGKLAIVFGCGGDRDPGKRPAMGQVASALADQVIVTDDNPRTENAATIRAQVLKGCTGAKEIGDRAVAIREAIAALREGDVLVIAGKGHESGQIVGSMVLPFDDAEQARNAARELGGVSA